MEFLERLSNDVNRCANVLVSLFYMDTNEDNFLLFLPKKMQVTPYQNLIDSLVRDA